MIQKPTISLSQLFKMGFYVSNVCSLKTLSSFDFFFSSLEAVLNGPSNPPLEDGFDTRIFFLFTFEIAPCLFERITRQSCAFCNRRKDLVAMLEEQLQIRQVYSWCTKLPSASITSHSHLHTSSRRFN